MYYLDTSFIIASLMQDEIRSEDARNWLSSVEAGQLAISDWVKTEVASALSLKVRTGQIGLADRAAASQQWHLMAESSLASITVDSDDFLSAAQFVEFQELSLRAGNALHIAIAKNAACTLVTLDKRMADAAVELGVPVARLAGR
ncbi:MAG: type II toxin-antitoxin system VapC family toxin [Sphingorhabdus sp.]